MSGFPKSRLLQSIDRAISRCRELAPPDKSAAERAQLGQLATRLVSLRLQLSVSDDFPEDSAFRMEMVRPFSMPDLGKGALATTVLLASQNLDTIAEIEDFSESVEQLVRSL